MPEKHLFEYAVIRVVPRVEREEFQNEGVILYCKSQAFLKTVFSLDETKLKTLHREIDIVDLENRLCSFQRICCGKPDGGSIGKMLPAERFRWLTSTRSTVIQVSAVHPGLCSEAEATLTRLFEQLVL